MKFKFGVQLFCIILIPLLFTACNRDEVQAKKSIEGTWDIVAITSEYGEIVQNSFNTIETISETGELGTFEFDKETVAYEFTRNDTLFTGNESWNITAEKVNGGFTRYTEFTLTIENQFLFWVLFENGTKNSEKKATTAAFTEVHTGGKGVILHVSVEKR